MELNSAEIDGLHARLHERPGKHEPLPSRRAGAPAARLADPTPSDEAVPF